jgi:hypothetical protein
MCAEDLLVLGQDGDAEPIETGAAGGKLSDVDEATEISTPAGQTRIEGRGNARA